MITWVEVSSKGLDWHVYSNGVVMTPAHESTYTRVRNGKSQTLTCSFPRRILSPHVTKGGYMEVAAMKNGKRVKHTLHRLIGMAFVPGYREDLTINHINGNKLDNRTENLEWVSLARNTQHQWETGLVDLRGEKQPGSKLTSKRVMYIRRLLAKGIPAHTIAVVAGMSSSMIELIRDGKRWPTVTAHKKVHASSPPASR